MAQVDTSIYNALLQRPKSAMEWQNDYAAQDDAAQTRQVNALALRDTQAKLADAEAARRRNALAISGVQGLGADATPEAIAGVYQRQGLVDQADKVLKSYTDREKERAATLKTSGETVDAALTRYRAMMDRVQSPQEAAQLLTAQYSDPVLGPLMLKTHGPLEAILPRIPTDPQGFAQYRGAAAQGMAAFQEKVAQKPTAVDLGDRKVMIDTNPNSPTYMKVVQENRVGMSPSEQSQAVNRELVIGPDGQPRVNQPYVDAKARVAQAGAPITMGAPVAGIDTRTGQPAFFQPGNRPGVAPQIVPDIAPAPKKGEGISATLQKELVEVDDLAQNSSNVGDALRRALSINDKAYSGYQATARAKVRSNLPGQDASADATIELENLIAGQGLESLRAIFGGNPTEGERKILLDLQASTDKTPAQRKAIIERAIQAADKRQQFAKNRAEAIRSGTYLSQGAAPVSAPAQQAAPAGQPRVINFGDLQ